MSRENERLHYDRIIGLLPKEYIQMTMIERVAQALEDELPGGENYEALARAAIAALREPTEEMVLAAFPYTDPRIKEIWQAMIDAALEGK